MIRLRTLLRPPRGVRPLVAGLALTAAGTALAAPSAVDTLDAAAARELREIRGETGIRPAAAEEPAATDPPRPLPAATGAAKPAAERPKPSASQLEVMKRLDEMYKRDGRGPAPSMRMKDAPNTRLPNGKLPGPPKSSSTSRAASGIQQASSPPPGMTSGGAATSGSGATKKKSRNPIVSFFSRKPSSAAGQRSTAAKRSTKPSSTSTVSGGGLFGRMLRPFRGEEKTAAAPASTQPPVPPPLPSFSAPTGVAKQPPAAPTPLKFQAATAQPLVPPAAPPTDFAGPSTPPSGTPEITDNPFADVPSAPELSEPVMVISPLPTHPLDDAFADVRGGAAPDAATIADLDPEFQTPVQIVDPGAPRPLDPEAVSSTEDFAPVRSSAPPTELPPPAAGPSAARLAELQRKLAERSGLGGFQGFCPVALRDRRELADARPEFLSVFQSRTYELSSAEAKARFEADPARYAPANGGNDPVLFVSRGDAEADGNLAHAVWFKDRLYLFRTAETLREFNAEPTRFAVAE